LPKFPSWNTALDGESHIALPNFLLSIVSFTVDLCSHKKALQKARHSVRNENYYGSSVTKRDKPPRLLSWVTAFTW